MKDVLVGDKKKPKNMAPSVSKLHNSLFICYPHSEAKNTSGVERNIPKIGIRLSHIDENSDTLTSIDPLSLDTSSNPFTDTSFQIQYDNMSSTGNAVRRSSNISNISTG